MTCIGMPFYEARKTEGIAHVGRCCSRFLLWRLPIGGSSKLAKHYLIRRVLRRVLSFAAESPDEERRYSAFGSLTARAGEADDL